MSENWYLLWFIVEFTWVLRWFPSNLDPKKTFLSSFWAQISACAQLMLRSRSGFPKILQGAICALSPSMQFALSNWNFISAATSSHALMSKEKMLLHLSFVNSEFIYTSWEDICCALCKTYPADATAFLHLAGGVFNK